MEIEACVGCGTEDNVWVFGRCTRCWLSRDEALNQQGHMGLGGCLKTDSFTLPNHEEPPYSSVSSSQMYMSRSRSPSPPPSTCDGCRYGYLNQQGHMSPGGCLHDDFLKTDSFTLPNHEEPPYSSVSSSQMYISRSRSPSPPPSSPCEKIYVCVHRNCQSIVEQPGSECGKCNKTPSWTQISDGQFCGFADCKECSVYPYSCRTCQCEKCGTLFSLKEDDAFTGACYECKHVNCSLCEEIKSDFDEFGVCLNCRTTSCTCGFCIRCRNLRRLAAPKLCPCGEESVSDLWLQCVDCYYDERELRLNK